MNHNKTFLLIAIILFNSITLVADTTVSLRERKKTLDSRVKIVKEIDTAMNGWNLDGFNERIHEIQIKSDSAYREKNATEQAKIMNFLEGDLHLLQLSYAEKMDASSQELIESFARETVKNRDLFQSLDLNRREKTQRYFDMAKKELESGRKYQRMNNPTLALYSYKRSILYSYHSYLESALPIPDSSIASYDFWMKKNPTISVEPKVKDSLKVSNPRSESSLHGNLKSSEQ
jgi:hypothetical protein